MKKVLLSIVSLVVVVVLPRTSFTGDLNGPDWGPQSGGGMYSLSDLYYYLTEGTAFNVSTNFTGPVEGPTVSTMMNLKTICDDIKASFDHQSMARHDQVHQGYYFFCTDTNYWGLQEGTAPLPPWYDVYGPSGTADVVEIGSMYVASSKDGYGCAGDGRKNWPDAISWSAGLNWLGKNDWRMPSIDELLTICSNKASLTSYPSYYTWSSTTVDGWSTWAWLVYPFDNCKKGDLYKTNTLHIRAVRDSD